MTKKRLRLFRHVRKARRSDGVGNALKHAFPVRHDEGDEAMQRLIDQMKAFEGTGRKPESEH